MFSHGRQRQSFELLTLGLFFSYQRIDVGLDDTSAYRKLLSNSMTTRHARFDDGGCRTDSTLMESAKFTHTLIFQYFAQHDRAVLHQLTQYVYLPQLIPG